MIQRIQSVYLLAAFICTVFLLFMPIGTVDTTPYISSPDFQRLEYNPFVLKDITLNSTPLSTLYIAITLIICSIFSLVAIFMYGNRKRQLNIVYANMLFFLLAILLMLFVYPNYIIPARLGIPKDSVDYNYWILACLVPAAVALMLASRAIKKDEQLVRAADRLR
ncbi:MAG: DUF4293 domain-containing protein [Bacteroidales bacterium]|jgi:hypothetical protein|nr:DUF4293 domain-containing protein [Bacteroidales bacterium]